MARFGISILNDKTGGTVFSGMDADQTVLSCALCQNGDVFSILHHNCGILCQNRIARQKRGSVFILTEEAEQNDNNGGEQGGGPSPPNASSGSRFSAYVHPDQTGVLSFEQFVKNRLNSGQNFPLNIDSSTIAW